MQDRTIVAARAKIGADPLLLVDRPQAGVAVLTMNRPDTRNALSLEMIDRLHARFTRLADGSAVAAIVLAANGPVFCAGHDLKELTAHRADADDGRAFYTEAMTRCSAMMQAIVACPKPVIAAVQGTATAAGCQLVATCDLAVAASEAKFATPGVNIGLFCSTPMVALSRNVVAQARHGDAAARRDALRRGCRRVRPHQPGRRRRAKCCAEALAWPPDRRQVAAHRRHRQSRVLPPARDAAEGSLRLCGARSWSRT